MERVELLTVKHTFELNRNSTHTLILFPEFPVPKGWKDRDWNERIETVTILRPDGTELEAAAQINTSHLDTPDPKFPESRWKITLHLTDRTKHEVPVGSRILVSPTVRNAILDATEK
jgi:hypothetical protein